MGNISKSEQNLRDWIEYTNRHDTVALLNHIYKEAMLWHADVQHYPEDFKYLLISKRHLSLYRVWWGKNMHRGLREPLEVAGLAGVPMVEADVAAPYLVLKRKTYTKLEVNGIYHTVDV